MIEEYSMHCDFVPYQLMHMGDMITEKFNQRSQNDFKNH